MPNMFDNVRENLGCRRGEGKYLDEFHRRWEQLRIGHECIILVAVMGVLNSL